RFYLCGNGAMTEDMATALSDLGAAEELIYQEHYFNQKHVPDPVTLAAIRARFVAGALSSPMAHHEGMPALFRLDRPVGSRRGGAGPAAPPRPGPAVPGAAEGRAGGGDGGSRP
ncbi:MAG: hypothetical protein ACLGIO_07215, partial [Acidimicrobiia bacterium]